MQITWDERKNQTNKAKHRVSFETAAHVFDDPFHFSILERVVDGEERWQTMGSADGTILLLVAHTYLDKQGQEAVRIISARRATTHERKRYEKAQ